MMEYLSPPLDPFGGMVALGGCVDGKRGEWTGERLWTGDEVVVMH